MNGDLNLYVREYCDLCSKMLAQLREVQNFYGFNLVVIDIEDSDELESKYASLIPVAEHQGKTLFYYHIEPRALDAAFGAIG